MSDARQPIGEELTVGEKELLDKLLSNWLLVPDSFKVAAADYVSQNVSIPIGQIQGVRGSSRYFDTLDTDASFTSTTETDAYSITIPARTITPGDILEATFIYNVSCADSDNTYTLGFFLGATVLGSVSVAEPDIPDTSRSGIYRMTMTSTGSFAEQFTETFHRLNFGSVEETAFDTSSVDLTADQIFKITVDWESAGTQAFSRKFVGVKILSPVKAQTK